MKQRGVEEVVGYTFTNAWQTDQITKPNIPYMGNELIDIHTAQYMFGIICKLRT